MRRERRESGVEAPRVPDPALRHRPRGIQQMQANESLQRVEPAVHAEDLDGVPVAKPVISTQT